MEMGWILGGFFVFVTFLYIAVAFVAPEWVGIQGKVAQKLEEEHQDVIHQKNKSDSENKA